VDGEEAGEPVAQGRGGGRQSGAVTGMSSWEDPALVPVVQAITFSASLASVLPVFLSVLLVAIQTVVDRELDSSRSTAVGFACDRMEYGVQ
jgi:hypothetical protein